MNAAARDLFRIVLCVAFVASLFGGMTLLTAAMFAQGHMILASLSGLILTVMTATALGLFSLAWSMLGDEPEEDASEFMAMPG